MALVLELGQALVLQVLGKTEVLMVLCPYPLLLATVVQMVLRVMLVVTLECTLLIHHLLLTDITKDSTDDITIPHRHLLLVTARAVTGTVAMASTKGEGTHSITPSMVILSITIQACSISTMEGTLLRLLLGMGSTSSSMVMVVVAIRHLLQATVLVASSN